jgi:DNA-binding NarL/FixJ family response regulator
MTNKSYYDLREALRPSEAGTARPLEQIVGKPKAIKADVKRQRVDARPIRILTADYRLASRDLLRDVLTAQTDFKIVGEARNADEVITLTTELNPDILLLDISTRAAAAVDLLQRLSQNTVRTILLTNGTARPDIVRLVKLGARGILPKDSPVQILLKSIRVVFGGEIWLKRQDFAEVVSALASEARFAHLKSPIRLTARQREVLALVTTGETNREVAQKLRLSEDTVKHHITKILDKTGMSGRVELVVFAIEHKLLETA